MVVQERGPCQAPISSPWLEPRCRGRGRVAWSVRRRRRRRPRERSRRRSGTSRRPAPGGRPAPWGGAPRASRGGPPAAVRVGARAARRPRAVRGKLRAAEGRRGLPVRLFDHATQLSLQPRQRRPHAHPPTAAAPAVQSKSLRSARSNTTSPRRPADRITSLPKYSTGTRGRTPAPIPIRSDRSIRRSPRRRRVNGAFLPPPRYPPVRRSLPAFRSLARGS